MGITSRMNIACLFLPAAGALWEALQPCFPFRERYLPCISICAAAAIAGSGPFRPFVKSQRGWTYAKLQCWGVSVFWQKLVYWQRPRTAPGKHNLYIILPFTDISDKKKRASALPGVGPHSTKIGHHSHFCIFILSFFSVFVKDFSASFSIFLGKVGHFLDNSLYPPKLTRQRKKSKSLSGT